MKQKDKIILTGSGEVIIDTAIALADQIVSEIPLLNIAWGLSKSLYGAGLKLRQKRALEWVEMIRDNPGFFTKEVLMDENFQDGFVYMLENYIRERNSKKRDIAKNIFLGFAKAEEKSIFSIEKFAHTLNQLSEKDIEVMKDVDIERSALRFDADGNESFKDLNYQIYGNIRRNRESIYNLINLGVLLEENTGTRLGPVNAPFVSLSVFGQGFMKFIMG